MSRFNNPLDHISVAAPCPADWDGMIGSDRVRYCGQCKLNVYNLSEMSRREAEALIERTEGRLCVRFYRRADGTIINRNCPVGLSALKRRLKRIRTAVMSALLGFFAGLGFNAVFNGQDGPTPYGMGHVTTGTMVTQGPQRVPVKVVGTPPVYERGMTIGKMAVKDSDQVPGLKQRTGKGFRR
ncbi:MAG TPA: hypothetical protein VGO91_07450 [Pyrinomonadaceae bacterium]|jgi:hypothetical protein|nr:hypothetical protein [Pyrinomonadaceae bacterium]